MKKLLILVLMLAPTTVFARGDSGSMGRFSIDGFYGLGSINPSDINGLTSQLPTTPKVSNVSSETNYGGALSFMLGMRWDLRLKYEINTATNYTNTNIGSNTGVSITEDDVAGLLRYHLIHNGSAFFNLGAGVAYPTTFTMTSNAGSTTNYTAAPSMGYLGAAEVGVMLGRHLSLFFDGIYESLQSGNVTASNTTLKNNSGQNATINMSGFKGNAGLRLYF